MYKEAPERDVLSPDWQNRRTKDDKPKYNYTQNERVKEVRDKLRLTVPEGERRYYLKAKDENKRKEIKERRTEPSWET